MGHVPMQFSFKCYFFCFEQAQVTKQTCQAVSRPKRPGESAGRVWAFRGGQSWGGNRRNFAAEPFLVGFESVNPSTNHWRSLEDDLHVLNSGEFEKKPLNCGFSGGSFLMVLGSRFEFQLLNWYPRVFQICGNHFLQAILTPFGKLGLDAEGSTQLVEMYVNRQDRLNGGPKIANLI